MDSAVAATNQTTNLVVPMLVSIIAITVTHTGSTVRDAVSIHVCVRSLAREHKLHSG